MLELKPGGLTAPRSQLPLATVAGLSERAPDAARLGHPTLIQHVGGMPEAEASERGRLSVEEPVSQAVVGAKTSAWRQREPGRCTCSSGPGGTARTARGRGHAQRRGSPV